jgi:hypothetical protein
VRAHDDCDDNQREGQVVKEFNDFHDVRAYFLKFRFNLESRDLPGWGIVSSPFFSQRSGPVDPKRITFQNAQRIVSEIGVTLVWNIYQSSRIVFLWSHLTKEIGAFAQRVFNSGGYGGGWNQFVAQSSGLVLESKESGFLESKLLDGWVKFLVGLFVFEQVVNEASQFARCSSGGLGRSRWACLRR